MFKIAVCDDEPLIGYQLEKIILRYAKTKSIDMEVFVYESGEEMLSFIQNRDTYDLIFLDIEFPQMNGVDIGKYIRNEMKNEETQIVYISSMQSHAMELFDVRPLNFLIKPLSEDRILDVLTKAMHLMQKKGRLFAYKANRSVNKVLISDILYFESIRREIRMVTTHNTIIFYGTLAEIYEQLKENRFFYPHKSFLVNYSHITHFSYEMIELTNGDKIDIAQPRRKDIRHLLSQYAFSEGEVFDI